MPATTAYYSAAADAAAVATAVLNNRFPPEGNRRPAVGHRMSAERADGQSATKRTGSPPLRYTAE